MATTVVRAPNGERITVRHPEGASDAEIIAYAQTNYMGASTQPPAEEVATPQLTDEELRRKYGIGAAEAPEGPTMGGEFGRSVASLLSSLRTTGAAAFGDEEEAALAGLERQQQIGEKYGEGPSLERVKRAYREDGPLSAAGEAISQIPSAVVGQLPVMGALATGAMAGQAAIPIPYLGGIIGAAAVGLPLFFGSDAERQAETQLAEGVPVDINTGRALAAAAGQTALESVGTAATLGKGIVKSILKIADDTGLDSAAARDLTGAALAKLRGEAAAPVTMGARAAAAGKGAGISALAEIPTEVAQQVIERAQAGLDVLSPEAFAEYGEAAYLAGVAGGTLGGATRVGEPGRGQRRAETRLREIAGQESQDLFTAERERQGADGTSAGMQPDLLGEIAPVMAPKTAAGVAQQEAAQQQDLLGEEYTTRAGDERFAPPGARAERTLPMIAKEEQAFAFMKERGLTKAVEPKMMSAEEQKTLSEVRNYLNEAFIMQRVAAEAPRMPRAEGEAPLAIDPRKPISELNAEEQDTLNRVLDQLTSKETLDKGKGQLPLPKALTNILVGEKATVATKAEQDAELAAAKKQQDRAATQAQKQQDRAATQAQKQQERDTAAAVKAEVQAAAIRARQEAQRQAAAAKAEAQKIKNVQNVKNQQVLPFGEPVDLKRQVRPEDAPVSGDGQLDIFAREGVKPAPAPVTPATQQATPKFPTTKEERIAFAKEVGLNPSLAMVRKDNGILAQYADQDLTDPAVAARLVGDLEIKKKNFTGDYADRNSAAVDSIIARFAPKKVEPTQTTPTAEKISGQAQTVKTKTKERQVGQKTSKATVTGESATDTDTTTTGTPVVRSKASKGRKGGADKGTTASVQSAAVENVTPTEDKPKASKARSKKYNEDDFFGEGVTEKDGAEALISFFNRDPSNPSLQRLVKESANWVDDPAAKAGLTETAKNIPGLIALENATASPKLEGDLLDAVTSGDLKKTIALLVAKMSGRPEAQQVLRKIQSLGLKTKIVVGAVPEEGLANVVSITSRLDELALQREDAEGKELFNASEYSRVANEIAKLKDSQADVNEMLAQARLIELLQDIPGAGRINFSLPEDTRYAHHDALRTLRDIKTLLDDAAERKNLFGGQLPRANALIAQHTTPIVEAFAAYISAARALRRGLNPRSPQDRALAKALDAALGDNRVVPLYGKARAGSYDPVTDTITLDPDLGMNEHTLVHELVHAALASRIADPKSDVAKEFAEFFDIIQNQLGGAYGGKDAQEFVAELIGNEDFATSLKAIKAPKGGNLLQRIVQAIAKFFGFRKESSVYDEGIKYINKLLNVPASVEPTVVNKLYMGTPTSAEDALRQIKEMRKPATDKQFDEARGALEKMQEKGSDFLRETFFRTLRMDNIYHMYKDAGPKFRPLVRALKGLMSALEKRTGFIEHWIDDANKKYTKFVRAAQEHQPAMKRMFAMAERARMEGIDLVPKSGFQPTPKQQEAYDQLNNVLKNLPTPVRDMYITMRKDYDAAYITYRDFMLEQYADTPTVYKEMRQKFEAEHPVAGYVPFMRFGDFVLEYTDAKLKRRVVQQFETRKERTDAIEELGLSADEYQEYSRLDEATYDANKIPSSSFLFEVMKGLKTKKASKQQIDAVYQTYLSMFPAESIRKRMMRSENVAGMSDDIIRAYANTMVQWARHMGNAMYTPQIDEELDAIASQRDVDDNLWAISKVLNSEDSRNFIHNPSYKGWVSGMTSVSYAAFILGNVSSAVLNLTSIPLLGLPLLGSKYGYDSATGALTAATKVVTPFALKDMMGKENVWVGMPAKYKKLIEVLRDHGQLQHTQTREILSGRKGETQIETNPAKRAALAAMDYGSRPFSATEKVNRAAIALAAYDLAIAGGNGVKPMNPTAAIQYALEAVKQVNTSGMAVTGPQLFQTDIGRIFGTFKTFAWNSAFIVAKSFYDSVRGATPEVRKIALRQLLGTMASAGAISGVSGMPFVMMITGATRAILSALFGDDEDDDKFISTDEWAQGYINDLFWKGPLNYVTGTAIADRAAITENLFFREDPKLVDDVGYVRATLLQALGGPAVGYVGNIAEGIKLANEGHYGRGLESILPSALGNVFKAWRFASEKGALTKDGEVIMEDINAYNIAMQAIGLAPSELSALYERRGQAMDVQDKVRKRKDRLLDLAWAAQQSGDEETFEEAREKLVALNRNHPGTIQKDTIQRSFRNKAASIRNSVTGLSFDKALRFELIRRFKLDEEKD